jgi:hypothetical protein
MAEAIPAPPLFKGRLGGVANAIAGAHANPLQLPLEKGESEMETKSSQILNPL